MRPKDSFDESFNGIDHRALAQILQESAPPGMPPEITSIFIEAIEQGLLAGETPSQVMERILGAPPPKAAAPKKKR
jgi:hypothetical protein